MDFRILGPLEVFDGGAGWRWGAPSSGRCWGFCSCTPTRLSRPTVLSMSSGAMRGWARGRRRFRSRYRDCAGCWSEAGGGRREPVLVTRPPGYELRAGRPKLDVERFEAQVAEGRFAAFAAGGWAPRRMCSVRRSGSGAVPPLADLTYGSIPWSPRSPASRSFA